MPKVTQLVLERAASRTQISWLLVPSVAEPSQHGLRAAETPSQIKASSIVQQGEHLPVFGLSSLEFSRSLEALYIPAVPGQKGRNALSLSRFPTTSPVLGGQESCHCHMAFSLFPLNCTRKLGIYRKCTISYCTRKQESANSLPILQIYLQIYMRKFCCPVVRTHFH